MTLYSYQYTDVLRQRIERHLGSFQGRSQADSSSLTRAAVVIAICKIEKGDNTDSDAGHGAGHNAGIYLTVRSSKLRKHAGQYALPGGKLDTGETEQQAGLRELSEELGINLSESEILGLLDDFPTRSGFAITPVVVWNNSDSPLRPNPDEVAAVHEIPLAELTAPDLMTLQETDTTPILSIAPPSVGTSVYSPTAAIIYQFAEVALLGRESRVAHYEQPDWAWR